MNEIVIIVKQRKQIDAIAINITVKMSISCGFPETRDKGEERRFQHLFSIFTFSGRLFSPLVGYGCVQYSLLSAKKCMCRIVAEREDFIIRLYILMTFS